MAFNFQLAWGWMDGKLFRVKASSGHPVVRSLLVGLALSSFSTHVPWTSSWSLPVGTIVRCTMASQLGDVGVNVIRSATGYTHRVMPFDLERIDEEDYVYVFDDTADENFRYADFREEYAPDIVEWTVDVLDRTWWEAV